MGRVLRAGAGLLIGLWAGSASAEVRVRSNSPCVDAPAWSERLEGLLRDYAGGAEVAAVLEVEADAELARTRLLVVARDAAGAPLLERAFDLEDGACRSALQLVETVVEGALRSLPIEAWTRSPAPPPAPPPESWGVRLNLGGSLGILPWAGRGELGALLLYGAGPHRLGVGLWAALGSAGPLGDGWPLENLFLLEAGWHWQGEPLELSFGLRSGVVVVAGLGYPEGERAAAFWIEGTARLAYRIGAFGIGLSLAAAPLDHQVSTGSGTLRRISPVRIGPMISVEL